MFQHSPFEWPGQQLVCLNPFAHQRKSECSTIWTRRKHSFVKLGPEGNNFYRVHLQFGKLGVGKECPLLIKVFSNKFEWICVHLSLSSNLPLCVQLHNVSWKTSTKDFAEISKGTNSALGKKENEKFKTRKVWEGKMFFREAQCLVVFSFVNFFPFDWLVSLLNHFMARGKPKNILGKCNRSTGLPRFYCQFYFTFPSHPRKVNKVTWIQEEKTKNFVKREEPCDKKKSLVTITPTFDNLAADFAPKMKHFDSKWMLIGSKLGGSYFWGVPLPLFSHSDEFLGDASCWLGFFILYFLLLDTGCWVGVFKLLRTWANRSLAHVLKNWQNLPSPNSRFDSGGET